MAVTPRNSTSASKAPATFAPATTGPYTLANAQAQGYTGGGSSDWSRTISATIIPEAPVYSFIGWSTPNQMATANSATANYNSTYWGKTPWLYTTTTQNGVTKTTSPSLNLSPVQKTQVGNVLGSFQSALASSKWDRASYNASINYDGMNKRRRKAADNFFERNSKTKKDKKDGEVVDPYAIITNRATAITEENKKQQKLLDQQAADAASEAMAVQEETQRNIDEQSGLISTERDTTISEQETLAKNAEDNRLNQLRGNIMTRLAQRGVDISRLSPEQITALSGEEWAKAFMDVTEIKDKKTKAIESVRQSALSKLNELRDKKSINQTTYTSRINEINSKTAAAKLQADKEFSANVFSLSQTKEQQSRADALARVTAAQNYLASNGVSGPVAANVIANLSARGLPDTTIQSIARDPKVIDYLKKVEESNLAQVQLDNQLKQGKLSIDEYDSQTRRIAANRPRSAGWFTIDVSTLGN